MGGAWRHLDVNSNEIRAPLPYSAPQQQLATGNTTVVGTQIDIVGATLTLPSAGTYLIWGVFDVQFPANTGADTFFGSLSVNGVIQPYSVSVKDDNTASGPRGTITGVWLVTGVGAGHIAKLRGQRSTGTGTCTIGLTSSGITALKIG